MVLFTRLFKKLLFILILYPLRLFKVKNNRIMFVAPCASHKYACNLKYICEYILNEYPSKFEIIYLIKDTEKYNYLISKKINIVKLNSFKQFYYALTSKVYVTNGGLISYIPFKKNQIIIDTWHGGGAYKLMGLDLFDNILYRTEVMLNAKKTKMFSSSCTKFSEIIERTLKIDKQCIAEIGMPRNDILVQKENQFIKEKVKKYYNIPENVKMVLYAPTYRNIKGNNPLLKAIAGEYSIDCARILPALQKKFGGEWCFAIRLHRNIQDKEVFPNEIYDFGDYDDMQELLCAADVLINDYSSSMWDFSLTGKPCFIFAQDIEKYKAERNLYTPVEEWPFPIAEDNNEFEQNILNFNQEEYLKKVKKHHEALGICETGHASQILGDKIYEVCFNEEMKR